MKRGHRHQLPRTLRVQPPGWAQRGAGSIGIMGTKLGLRGPNWDYGDQTQRQQTAEEEGGGPVLLAGQGPGEEGAPGKG